MKSFVHTGNLTNCEESFVHKRNIYLKNIARYLFDNIGNTLSAKRIADYLKAQRLRSAWTRYRTTSAISRKH